MNKYNNIIYHLYERLLYDYNINNDIHVLVPFYQSRMFKSEKSTKAVLSIVESIVVDFLEFPFNFSKQCELMDSVMQLRKTEKKASLIVVLKYA